MINGLKAITEHLAVREIQKKHGANPVGNIARVLVSILAVLAVAPSSVDAQSFTSRTFLSWKTDSQDFYIEASVGMASLIAAQQDKTQGDCIDDWYFGDEAEANGAVRSAMEQYPEYHPRGIILAVLQRECGDILD